MIRIERVRRLEPIAIDEAFDYVVDFSHIDDWDRGVASASRLEGTGVEVGARFEVMSLFFGRTVPLVYEITESLPPDRAVLKTRSRRFDAADTIELTAAGSTATTIRYTAEFRFRGVMRVLEPLLRRSLTRVVERALAGLETTVATRSEPEGSPPAA